MNCLPGRLTLPLLTIACLFSYLTRPVWADPTAAANDRVSVQSSSPPSALANALLGHWVNEDGTHYYVGQQQITVLYIGQANVHKQKLSYAISSLNEVANSIEIRVETPSGWAQERQLHLATDWQSPVGDHRRSLTETMDITGHFFSSTWTYVDDQQQPLSFLPAQVGASTPEASVAEDGVMR